MRRPSDDSPVSYRVPVGRREPHPLLRSFSNGLLSGGGHVPAGYFSSFTPMPVGDGVRVTSSVVAGDDTLNATVTPFSLVNDT
jgi:hypothetical protein